MTRLVFFSSRMDETSHERTGETAPPPLTPTPRRDQQQKEEEEEEQGPQIPRVPWVQQVQQVQQLKEGQQRRQQRPQDGWVSPPAASGASGASDNDEEWFYFVAREEEELEEEQEEEEKEEQEGASLAAFGNEAGYAAGAFAHASWRRRPLRVADEAKRGSVARRRPGVGQRWLPQQKCLDTTDGPACT